jgi:hypothetical protein
MYPSYTVNGSNLQMSLAASSTFIHSGDMSFGMERKDQNTTNIKYYVQFSIMLRRQYITQTDSYIIYIIYRHTSSYQLLISNLLGQRGIELK